MKRTIISILLFASCITTYQLLSIDSYYYTKHFDPKDTSKMLKCGKDYLGKLQKILTKTEIISSITPQDLRGLQGAEFRCFLDGSEQRRVGKIVDKLKEAQRLIKDPGTAQMVATYHIDPVRYSIRSLIQRISNQVNDLQPEQMYQQADSFLMLLRNIYSKTNMQAISLITPQELRDLRRTEFRDLLDPHKQAIVSKIILLIENAQFYIKAPGADAERIVEKDCVWPARKVIDSLMQMIRAQVDKFQPAAWKL